MNAQCFDLSKWQTFKMGNLEDSVYRKQRAIALKKLPKRGSASNLACVLFHRTISDSTYMFYGYFWQEHPYVFAWETLGDERHKAYSKATRTIYDDLEQGSTFEILLNPSKPSDHFICNSKLKKINTHVIQIVLPV